MYFREEHIIAMGVMIMRIVVLIVVLQVAQVIYMGCLRGAGDVFFTTVASTFSVTNVRPGCVVCSVLYPGSGSDGNLAWGPGGSVQQVCTDQLAVPVGSVDQGKIMMIMRRK